MKNIQSGQSLVEIIIALALLVILIVAVSSVLLFGLEVPGRSRDYLKAQMLAREGLEAARAVYQQNESQPVYSVSAVVVSDNHWTLLGSGTSEQFGKFSREISYSPVYRDPSTNEIVSDSDPGAYWDQLSINVLARVSWEKANGTDEIYDLEHLIISSTSTQGIVP